MSGVDEAILENATKQQAANIVQKAMLDMVMTKFTRIIGALKEAEIHAGQIVGKEVRFSLMNSNVENDSAAAEKALNTISDVLRMNRFEVAEMRSQPEWTFQDEQVQEIVTEAVDRITAILLNPPRPEADGH